MGASGGHPHHSRSMKRSLPAANPDAYVAALMIVACVD
jgi:hypothetical protein